MAPARPTTNLNSLSPDDSVAWILFSSSRLNDSEIVLFFGVESVYVPEMQASVGFDLWRESRRARLVGVEIRPMSFETLERLVDQGVPVLAGIAFRKGRSRKVAAR